MCTPRLHVTEAITTQPQVYHAEAKPVEDYYAKQGVLVDFEITGGIPETLPRLLDVLRSCSGAPQKQEAVA